MADFLLSVGVDVGLSYDQMQKDISNLVSQLNSNPARIRVELDASESISNLRTQISELYNTMNSAGAAAAGGGRGGGFRRATENAREHTIALRTVIDMYTQMHSLMGRNTNATGTATWDSLSTHAQQFASVLELVQSHEITVNEALHRLGINGADFIENARVAMSAFRAEVEHTGTSGSVNLTQMYTLISQMQTLLNNNPAAMGLGTYTELQNSVGLFAQAVQISTTENISLESALERVGLSGATAIETARAAMAAFRAELSGATFEEGNITRNTYEYYNALKQVDTLLGQIRHNREAWTAARNGVSRDDYNSLGVYERELLALEQRIRNTTISAREFRDSLSEIRSGVVTANNSIKTAGEATKTWGERIGSLSAKFSTWFSITRVVMAAYRVVRQMVTNVSELDTAMTELRKVTNETNATYEKFLVRATSRAKELGASLTDTVNATADFARLGYGLKDAEKLADAAIVYKNVGEGIEDIGTASESIIATMQAFAIPTEQVMTIVDRFNKVGNNFAISSKGVGDALLRSAAALHSANNTLDESIALATAANTIVQDPDKVGTTLKTVSMYLRAAKTDAEEAGESVEGMANSISDLRDELLALTGNRVDIQLDENTFKSTYQILKELSVVWRDISDISQANILELVGGKRNSNVVAALLENFTIAEKVVEASASSAGSALAENEKVLESIQGSLNVFKATFEDLSQNLISEDFIKGIIDFGTTLLNILNIITKIINVFGGLNTVLYTTLAIFTVLKVDAIISGFTKLAGLIGSLVGFFTKLRAAMTAYAAITATTKNASAGAMIVYGQSTSALSRLSTAFKSVGISASTAQLAVGGIVAALIIVIGIVNKVRRTQKEAVEKTNEFLSKFEEQRSALVSNKKTIDSISADYEKLAKGVDSLGRNVSLNTDEYTRYNDIVNQIADMFPQMIQGYTDEGNAIIKAKGNVEELTKAYQDQKKAYQDSIIVGSAGVYKGFKAKVDNNPTWAWEESGLIQMKDAGDRIVDALKNDISGVYNQELTETLSYILNPNEDFIDEGTPIIDGLLKYAGVGYTDGYEYDAIRNNKQKIISAVSKLTSELNAETAKIKPIMQAYLDTSFEYQTVDEDVQDIVKQIANQFDYKFYSQFDNEIKMASWIDENVVQKFQDNDELTSKFNLMFGVQTQFNNGDIPVSDYQDKLTEFLTLIEPLDDQTEKAIKLLFGITTKEDGSISSDVDTMIANVQGKLQDEFNDKVGELEIGDLEIASKLKIDTNAPITWEELIAKIEEYKEAAKTIESPDITLDNLTKASEGISSLQKAFKELSDDGYITTDTISKIKEVVGDSITNWGEYENILLTAKAGSEEFSQALNDLTYATLENEMKTEGLANASEEYVAAVLRENGVANANEVAIAMITQAKGKLSAQSVDLSEGIELDIKALEEEADKCGLAKDAYLQLVAAEIVFGDNKLDVSEKVEKLKKIAVAAGVASQALADTLDPNILGRQVGNRGISVVNYVYEKLFGEKSEDVGVDFEISSSKNEALDNALKQAERLYKVHQNELEYIKDLKVASDNYAKTKEEQLEIEDKIAEAHKDYAQNQIEDIEHQIEMLQNLEGEDANVLKHYEKIQNIAHAEAGRLRDLGYDDNSSEIQELQKQWWSAKQAIDEYRRSLLDTRIADYEHDIFLLEKNEADSQKILEIYRKMQEEVHAEAEYYRSLGVEENDERIQELQKQWWGYQDNIEEVKEEIISNIEEMVSEVNDLLDGFQDVYTTLTDAAKEYNSTGYLSVDSLQSILELSPKYLGFLYDENGQLVLNEQALQNVIAAQTEEMAVQNALAYAKQILNAAEQKDIETLTTLTQITTEGSNATWDMAYATLALAKAVGTANGMDSGYFDSAVSYIDKMQSLSKIAVNSISSYYKTLDEGYISQKDALDQILDLTQDLIKWEQEQLIESLEKQKEDYQEIIDKKKEMLELTQEESDHEKSVAEKLQEIAKLQSRIEQLSLDDSREAQAQKKGLEEDLNELQKELADDQADYAVDVQIDALDKELEAFEDAKDDEIKAQKEMLDSAEELYQAAISRIENDWDGLYQDLLAWNAEYGSTLQSELVNAWDAASAAVQRYGSFVEAYANADNYTDIGDSSGGSGITSSESASNIVSAMKQNSLDWFTATSKGERDSIEKTQQGLVKQYESITGEKLTPNRGEGTWEKSDGTTLYTLDKNTVAKHIVNQMKTNSKLWNQTSSDGEREELRIANEYLAQTLENHLGRSIIKDGNGVWHLDNINGKELFKEYHTGGIVGNNPTLKQNEVMTVLEKGELVLDEKREEGLYKFVDFAQILSDRLGTTIDISKFNNILSGLPLLPISSPSPHAGSGAIDFSPNIEVNITHNGSLSDNDARRYGDMIAQTTLDKLSEAFSRRGVSTIGNAMLK